MAPPQQIESRDPSESPSPHTKEHPHPPSNPSSPILPRLNNPPTTHDPTAKPPWKKHKLHPRPPTSDWALLWPRPPSWRCPPGASSKSGYAGCEYIDAPLAFDPEIEGLPDWMGPKEKEQRLWSGIERVVVVPGTTGKERVEKREVDGLADGEDREAKEVAKAVHKVHYPPPVILGSRSKSTSVSPSIELTTTSRVMATATVTATSTVVSSSSPTLILEPATTELKTSTGTTLEAKIHTAVHIFLGIILPGIFVIAFLIACGYGMRYQWKRYQKGRSEKKAKKKAGRARKRDGMRVQEEEIWEELSLR